MVKMFQLFLNTLKQYDCFKTIWDGEGQRIKYQIHEVRSFETIDLKSLIPSCDRDEMYSDTAHNFIKVFHFKKLSNVFLSFLFQLIEDSDMQN